MRRSEKQKGKGSRSSGFSSEDTVGERREEWGGTGEQEWGHSVSGLECQDQKGDSVRGDEGWEVCFTLPIKILISI